MDIDCQKGSINLAPYSAYNGVRGRSPLGEIYHPYDVPWQQAKQMDDDAKSIKQGKPMLVPGEELSGYPHRGNYHKSAGTGQSVAL